MIGSIVTDKDGNPVDGNGTKLAVSAYNPSDEVKKLFTRCQSDYQIAWSLQNRPFDEFDGYSLLQRTKMDQETFGAFVGAEYVPQNKRWRWKGRKNTARNMIIGILAHVLAGMLFPYCYAYNEDNEEDDMTARVMRILIEDKLKKAGYEIKFMYMMTSALVNPAVFVEIEHVLAMQRIKVRNPDGTYRIQEAVDELLSGLNLHIMAIDSILLGDFYTFDLQKQPFIVKVRRITYDQARAENAGKYFVNGVDQFDSVQAGMTRIVMSGVSNQTLYDIEWTEADRNFVQELTFYYRGEDLETKWVGGVFMGSQTDVYNSNPFKHRRMALVGNDWLSIPIYPFAKSGFEPLDPQMRFAYYKSAAFKEFWDDASQNRAYQLAQDGMSLDVMKPIFLSGVAKVDSTVLVPGATIGMPAGASATPYQLGPNVPAALQIMQQNITDLQTSTQNQNNSTQPQQNVSATAVNQAQQSAQVLLGVFGGMIVDLVKQIGDLVIDDTVMHDTIGTVDATVPVALDMKFRTLLSQGKENGKDVTNKIQFDSSLMGWDLSKSQANDMEWSLFKSAGGMNAKQRVYQVNPYKFARHKFSLYIDPDMVISRSMGTDQLRKERAFNMMMDPRVAPFVNQQAVVDKFVIEEYSDGDPDEFKSKNPPTGNMLNTAMGVQPGATPLAGQQPQAQPQPQPMQI